MSRTRVKLRDRFLAALLSVLMIVAMIPVTTLQAFAATTEYPDAYTVTVKDEEGVAVEGATVNVYADFGNDVILDLSATTDANGTAAIDNSLIADVLAEAGLGSTSVTLTVSKDGYETHQGTAGVNASDPYHRDVTLLEAAVAQATVSVTVTGDATVEVNGVAQNSATVDVGTDVPVKITPAAGSYIKNLTVGGETVPVNKGEAYSGTITTNADVAIVATVVVEYTVSAPAAEGGAITLNGGNDASLTVDENAKVTVGVTANAGYQISSVSIGGAAQTLENDTTFNKEITVTANTEVIVTFAKVYTVTVTHNGNGQIEIVEPATAGGTVTVETGTDVKIKATPDADYRVSAVTINGVTDDTVTGANDTGYEKTLTADKDYTVVITFAQNLYVITKGTTENGTITLGSEVVSNNGSCEVTVTPDAGYSVASVKVNGNDVATFDVVNGTIKFTITSIWEAKHVEATFVETEKATIDVKDLFNDDEAIRVDGMTFIYANNSKALFKSMVGGIILYDKNDQVIDKADVNELLTIDNSIEIAKIELTYWATGEICTMPHELVGVSAASPLKIVIDTDKTVSTLTPDAAHSNGFYNNNFNVKLEAKDLGDFSGIASIEYFVTSTVVTGTYDEIQASAKTESGTLYTYTDTVEDTKTVYIPVTASKNDSDNVVVWAKITDRAGNVETIKTDALKVCVTAPKLMSVVVSGTKAADAENGYFDTARTATITIVDRASAFNEIAATEGIVINAKDANGNDVAIAKPAMISWVHNGDNHVATIKFETNANYTWSFTYKNDANLTIDKSSAIETGDNKYEFTVDGKAPTASISIDVDNTWNKLLSTLTFGIWKNYDITATATASDEIAGVEEIVYYKSNSDVALTETELEALYKDGEFDTNTFTVSADEKFTVYARITDKAGNTLYISTDGLIYDLSDSVITLNPEAANSNGFYRDDVKVDILVNEVIAGKAAYSGIKTIDYKVIKDNDLANPTQSGNLYTFDVQNPKYADLISSWTGSITVDAALNNSDNVQVVVTVFDNAGNDSHCTLDLDIDVTNPTIDIFFSDEANMVDAGRGYFGAGRVANVKITERTHHFDPVAATNGIVITAVDKAGNPVANAYEISNWTTVEGATPDAAVHTATITFKEDANYTWSISYKDKADNVCAVPTTGTSITPYTFTVDTTAPTGTVTVNENTWDKLLNVLTFGIFSNVKADVSATYKDVTSPIAVEYIKVSNNEAPILLSKDALDTLYENGRFSSYDRDFSVEPNEQFVIYIRITDYAGNYTYINSDGAIVDMVPSEIVITPENANGNGLYGHAYDNGIQVDISVSDAEPYSGIKSVDYKVVMDNDSANPTQSGNLYTFNNPSPAQADLKENWTGSITVDPALNNSCNVVVYVTVVDNAGNTSTNSKAIDIDVTKPTIDITFTDDVAVNKTVDNRGYFAGKRVATVKITERTHHFDATAATKGIVINAVDAKGNPVANAYEISNWTTVEGATPDAAVHTATITFKEDANYTWSISYKDKADNQNETPTTGSSVTPYTFTVDTTAPTGTVKAATAENPDGITWDTLRGTLTFGIWSKKNITVTGTSDDATSDVSGNIVEYYKVVASSATDGTTALKAEDLDAVSSWEKFTSLKVDKDEQFTVYIKITDLAGNYTYISTNGLIVDHNAPLEETVAPEVTVEPEQPVNGLYNGDVKVDIKVVDPLVGGTYSGLKKIWYEVKNMGEVTQTETLYEFTNNDPKQEDLLQTWTGDITVKSNLNNSNDVEIIVYAQDNSLNGSDKTVAIKIDITKPTILVSYDNNSADSDTFFKDDRTATVIVTERNFDPKDVVVSITNTDGVVPVISEFTQTKEGTGNKDDAQWTATIKYTADGDYTFDIAYTDLAKNVCDGETFAEGTVASNAFTVEQTDPIIKVTYDNNDALNGNYYKAIRVATVVISEHNLEPNGVDKDRIKITVTATDDDKEITAPVETEWTTSGNTHTATITYNSDALYSFDITVKDKAGNEYDDYAVETFYVDKTAPTLDITGVADQSANNGDVIPVVSYSDTNYDAEKVTITLSGANRGAIKELLGRYTDDVHNGNAFKFDNFANKKEIDDIYTLTATLTDKAGNTTEKKITFSVNRFGSTYAMSDAAKKLNGTYVKEPVDVVVTETNANELKNIKITLFKNNETIALTENEDYKIDVTGGNGAWYHYTYTVFAKNFADDGVYRLTFHSEDAAGNVAENTLDTKDTEVSFGVDATKPNIVVANLENGVTYALENMTVNMSVSDNLLLNSITVYLDNYDKAYKTWTAEEISEIIAKNGEFTFDIAGDSKSAHKVKIVSVDAAGNEQVEEITDFFVTTDILVRYYNNKPLFFGSIAGVIVLAGLIVFLVVYKRKKKEDK